MARFLKINFPEVKVKHIPELSRFNYNIYELISIIDCVDLDGNGYDETKIYIIEECNDDNTMTYSLTKKPESKNYEDVLFRWETSWSESIRFDKC